MCTILWDILSQESKYLVKRFHGDNFEYDKGDVNYTIFDQKCVYIINIGIRVKWRKTFKYTLMEKDYKAILKDEVKCVNKPVQNLF